MGKICTWYREIKKEITLRTVKHDFLTEECMFPKWFRDFSF